MQILEILKFKYSPTVYYIVTGLMRSIDYMARSNNFRSGNRIMEFIRLLFILTILSVDTQHKFMDFSSLYVPINNWTT